MAELGSLYEEKVTLPTDSFEVASKATNKSKKAKSKKPFTDFKTGPKSGPANASNFKEALIDPETATENNYFQPKKFSQNCEKMEVETINNFMNKSIFDKLYEDVMNERLDDVETQDADALGLPGEDKADGDEEVTITLDKETAKKLHEVLAAVISVDETPADDASVDEEPVVDGSEDAEEEDEDEDTVDEATELTALPNSKGTSLQSKSNKVGDVTSRLVSKGHGDGKVTAEVDGDGKPLADSKGKSLEGKKSNKVDSETSKVGAYLASLKK
jgi:hypothetical protein